MPPHAPAPLTTPALLKPFALPPQPVVAIVAPASSAHQGRIDNGAAALAARGWQVRFMPHAQRKSTPYFSASVADRLADLHAAFADPEVDALLCTRGGYGSNYLLPLLDLDLIRQHPKPLLGYSDMTAIQSWLLDRTGLVAFHAPMLAADFYLPGGIDEASLHAALQGTGAGGISQQTYTYSEQEGLRVLRPAAPPNAAPSNGAPQHEAAQGALYGGCLTLLTAALGTPYAPATEGKLLFLEDVGVKPYQIDRMLRQLVLAGKLQGVSGIIFGEMLDCSSPGAPPGLLEQAILHALADFPGPIAIGLRSGHVSRANVTLPLGVQARLTIDEAKPQLTLLEAAVQPRTASSHPDVRS